MPVHPRYTVCVAPQLLLLLGQGLRDRARRAAPTGWLARLDVQWRVAGPSVPTVLAVSMRHILIVWSAELVAKRLPSQLQSTQ